MKPIVLSVALLLAANAFALPTEPGFEEPSMAPAVEAKRPVPYLNPATGKPLGYFAPPAKKVARNEEKPVKEGDTLRRVYPITPPPITR